MFRLTNEPKRRALALFFLLMAGVFLVNAAPAADGDLFSSVFDDFTKALSVIVGSELKVNQDDFYRFIHSDESKRQFNRDVIDPFWENLAKDGDEQAQARLNEACAVFAREKVDEFLKVNAYMKQ